MGLYAQNILDSYLVESLFNGKNRTKFEFGYRSNICKFQNKQLNKRRAKGLRRIDYNLDIISFIRQMILFKVNYLKSFTKNEREDMSDKGKFLIDSDFNENTSDSEDLGETKKEEK